jgi:hypothetical protein
MSWLISSFPFWVLFHLAFSLRRHLDRAHVVSLVSLQMKSTPIGILFLLHILSLRSACTYMKGLTPSRRLCITPTLHTSGHYSHVSSGTQMCCSYLL